jgi:hypothetical protein
MRTIITILFLFICLNHSFAQVDARSSVKLKNIYYDKINSLKENRTNVLKDSIISNAELKNIITLKTNEYNAISEIADSTQRKRLMNERIQDLDYFVKNTSNKKLVSAYLKSNVSDVKLYSHRIDSVNSINGLEGCASCAIWRNVRFFVLTVKNNKLDTINCATVNYKKFGFQGRKLTEANFETFPCSKTVILSLNGNYGRNVIEVYFNKKKYQKEFAINAGKSEDDVYMLSFVLDEKYLVND